MTDEKECGKEMNRKIHCEEKQVSMRRRRKHEAATRASNKPSTDAMRQGAKAKSQMAQRRRFVGEADLNQAAADERLHTGLILAQLPDRNHTCPR